MARQVPPQKKSSRVWMACGIAAVLLCVMAVAVVIGFSLLRSRNWQKGLAIRVEILAPQTGAQVDERSTVELQASGADPGGISRLEIYADGALIAAQDAPGARGENPLILNKLWTPQNIGRHILLARGYTPDDRFADSSIVYVDVVKAAPKELDVDSIPKAKGAANPSLADIAAAYGVSPATLAGSNPSLSGTDPASPLPPGTRVNPPPSPGGSSGGSPPPPPSAPNPPTSPRSSNPAAPTGLRVSADCAYAILNWVDSPDETSYRIYRIAGLVRNVIGSVAANTTTFRNALPPIAGRQTYSYQVASVRDGREGISSMVTAITPETCPGPSTPPGTTSDLVLTVATVNTDAAWQGIYCYISINSSAIEKIPPGDFTFFAPDPSNNLYYNLTRLANGGRFYLTHHPTGNPVTLQGRCRGRRGPTTEWLDTGYFSISHPQADWDGTMRSVHNGSYRFSYCLGLASGRCNPVIPGAVPPGYTGIVDITELLLYLPAPTNLQITRDASACRAITNPVDQFACSLGMSLCAITRTCEGRRPLLWNWTESAFVPESSLTGYTVERVITNLNTAARRTNTWSVGRQADGTLPKHILGAESDLPCSSLVEFRARANQGSRVSSWSDPLVYTTALCSNAAYLEITFQTLQITGIDDRGEFCLICPARDQTIEPCGNISAGGGSLPWTIKTFSSLTSGIEAGTHNWSGISLYTQPSGGRGYNNNVFQTYITDPSSEIVFGSWITDVDHYDIVRNSRQTVFCDVSTRLPPLSIEEWSHFNQTFTMRDDRSPEADCIITVNIHGYPARR